MKQRNEAAIKQAYLLLAWLLVLGGGGKAFSLGSQAHAELFAWLQEGGARGVEDVRLQRSHCGWGCLGGSA